MECNVCKNWLFHSLKEEFLLSYRRLLRKDEKFIMFSSRTKPPNLVKRKTETLYYARTMDMKLLKKQVVRH